MIEMMENQKGRGLVNMVNRHVGAAHCPEFRNPPFKY